MESQFTVPYQFIILLGPYSSFSVGHLEGHAVLDGLRATLNFKPAGVKSTAVLGGLGYSGGAIATGESR